MVLFVGFDCRVDLLFEQLWSTIDMALCSTHLGIMQHGVVTHRNESFDCRMDLLFESTVEAPLT